MKKSLYFLCILAWTLALAACQSPADGAADPSTSGWQAPSMSEGTTADAKDSAEDVVLRLGAVETFDRRREGQSLVFDTLTRLDEMSRAKPQLVTDWTVSDDYRRYTLQCRTDLSFHDGRQVSPEDYKYAIETFGTVNYKSYAYVLDTVEADEDGTVEVTLTAPYMELMENLADCPLVPAGSWSEDGQMTSFVGTGPFVYERTDSGETTYLTRNPDYWNPDYHTDVTAVEWFAIPDEQTRKLALVSGKVDILGLSEHYISLPYSVLDELIHDGSYAVMHEDTDSYTSVGAIMCNWKEGPLADKKLRQALAKLVDREEIVETIFFGIPEASGHIYNPDLFDGPRHEAPVTFDPDGARSLLEQAGFTPGDERTPCVNADGEPLVLRMMTNTEEHQKDLSLYLQGAFKRYGIELDVQNLEGQAAGEIIKEGAYELHVGHPWFAPLLDSLGYMGLSDVYSEYGLGVAVNDAMKQAVEAYIGAPSPDAARDTADTIWRIQYEEALTIPIFADLRYLVSNDTFEGFRFDRNVFQIDLNGVVLRDGARD